MAVNLKGRSFLTLLDFSPSEIRYLLDLAHDLKAKKRAGILGKMLLGKKIVLLFEKTSTRTRCAFEVAALEEGGHVTFLDQTSSQFAKKESVEDSAKVFGRFYDAIEYRGYKQSLVEDLAKYSGVPVFNGLTDIDHPTQILADLMTIEEHIHKPLAHVKVAYVGDIRNNMCYAWMYGCAKMGMHFVAYGPKELLPSTEIVAKVNKIAEETGAKIEISDNPAALVGVDVLYTDVWVSMGEEAKMVERVQQLSTFRVDMKMLQATKNPEVKFMHCLPAYHDFDTVVARQARDELGVDIREVTDEVFRSNHSIVFDEAENRMHTIKAVMVATI